MIMNKGIAIEADYRQFNTPFVTFIPEQEDQKKLCFSPEECDYIIGMHKEKKSYSGKTYSGLHEETRSVDIVDLEFDQKNDWIYRRIITNVYTANERWWKFDISGIQQEFSLGRYKKSSKGRYLPHTDYNQIGHWPRKITVIVQLTNPKKYEGCQTKLYTGGHEEIIIPQTQGSMTLFPSYCLHEVTQVTKGSRYTMFGWVNGPHWK